MRKNILIKKIKQTIHDVEPGADIILYGSRSRGDACTESDWDLLILVEGTVDDIRTDRIRHRLYEIEWETGEVISSIVRNQQEWNSDLYQTIPFHQRVLEEGVNL
ncbi:MAG TPA: nucleotidyltransferase domain-containing protein [Desulfotignum sp.]|nr:nucleotidyltransferase domain-containing protein [Desulfotignum sp.]